MSVGPQQHLGTFFGEFSLGASTREQPAPWACMYTPHPPAPRPRPPPPPSLPPRPPPLAPRAPWPPFDPPALLHLASRGASTDAGGRWCTHARQLQELLLLASGGGGPCTSLAVSELSEGLAAAHAEASSLLLEVVVVMTRVRSLQATGCCVCW